MTLFKIIGASVTALLLWASFPPASESNSAWLALVPLMLIVRWCSPRESFKWAFLSALGFWVMTLSWFPAIIKNGGPWYLVILGQTALAAWCALFTGLFAFASSSLWRRCRAEPSCSRIGMILLVDPLLWAGTEYMRGTLLSGFAWNFLGVSQVDNTAVIQVAAVGGVYAVSALLVMVNGALTSIVERAAAPLVLKVLGRAAAPRRTTVGGRLLKSAESFVPILCVMLCVNHGVLRIREWQATQTEHPLWRIVLVQPNTPCIFINNDETMRRQLEFLVSSAEQLAASKPHLVIWPETALPGSVPYDAQSMEFVMKAVRAAGAPVLTGTLETERVEKSASAPHGMKFYNAAWMFSAEADGTVIGRYRKQHLVPFGEFIPFDKTIPILQKLAPTGVSCTPGEGPSLIELSGEEGRRLRVGALICFEDTIPALSRRSVRAGANVLTLLTNDAWFNGSVEPLQHLCQSVFRAVECGVPLVRVANSGVSCVVDRVGRINQLAVDGRITDVAGAWMTPVRIPESGTPTAYLRTGDWTLAIPGALLVLLVAGWALKRGRDEKNNRDNSERDALLCDRDVCGGRGR